MITAAANKTKTKARRGEIASKAIKKTYVRISTMNTVTIASIVFSRSGTNVYLFNLIFKTC